MKLKKEWYKAISIRTSRRTYEDKRLNQGEVIALTALIRTINRETGLNIQLVEDGAKLLTGFKASYGMISGARTLIALVGDKKIEDLKRLIGYYGELIVLECTALGLGTCWLGGTYDREACEKQIHLTEDEELICVISVGYVKGHKSLRENMISNLSKMAKTSIVAPPLESPEIPLWVKAGIEAAQFAQSAINKKPVGYSFENGKIKAFITKKNQGHEEVDLGISMAHFQLGALNSQYEGDWKKINSEYIFE